MHGRKSLVILARNSADGWRATIRFIYEVLAWAGLPWVYGGEYDQFSEIVTKIVKAWLSVGLRLYFVFDGTSA